MRPWQGEGGATDPVEIGRRDEGHEELGAVGVGSTVGHAEVATVAVEQVEALVVNWGMEWSSRHEDRINVKQSY